jgi:hypothetical protein
MTTTHTRMEMVRAFPWPPREEEDEEDDQVYQRKLLGDVEAHAPEAVLHVQDDSTCVHGVEIGEQCDLCEETARLRDEYPYDR